MNDDVKSKLVKAFGVAACMAVQPLVIDIHRLMRTVLVHPGNIDHFVAELNDAMMNDKTSLVHYVLYEIGWTDDYPCLGNCLVYGIARVPDPTQATAFSYEA